MPTITALVISEVLLPQSNIMAAFVHSHISLFSDVCPGLPKYNNHNVTQFTMYKVRSLPVDPLTLLHKLSNCQLPTYNNHNVTQFTLYTVRSLPADPLTLLHKLSNRQHKTIIMSQCLQCTQYGGHILLTNSHSCTNCPTVNIQQSQCHTIYSVHSTFSSC
jgi:hypothetical protein